MVVNGAALKVQPTNLDAAVRANVRDKRSTCRGYMYSFAECAAISKGVRAAVQVQVQGWH
jgi:hypothetical protein